MKALEALRAEVRRLDLAERDAYATLAAEINAHPPTRRAHEQWRRARERQTAAAARLDVLEAHARGRRG
jgi:hypothetical protein